VLLVVTADCGQINYDDDDDDDDDDDKTLHSEWLPENIAG